MLDALDGALNGRRDTLDAALDGVAEHSDVALPPRRPLVRLLVQPLVGAGRHQIKGRETGGAGGAHSEDLGAGGGGDADGHVGGDGNVLEGEVVAVGVVAGGWRSGIDRCDALHDGSKCGEGRWRREDMDRQGAETDRLDAKTITKSYIPFKGEFDGVQPQFDADDVKIDDRRLL